jgi:hypothetical protein
MAVEQITAAQYVQQLRAAILARNSSYDVDVGPIPDLIINPVANTLERQNADVRKLQSLLLLLNNGDYTSADLRAFVANEGIGSSDGIGSTVVLTFSTAMVNSDLTVGQGFPVGTLADESSGVALTFVVASTTILPVASKASYFNAATQKYELSVSARCTSIGANTNVAANRITNPRRPIVGFQSITNKQAAQGGRDQSTDGELIEQYLIAITGTNEAVPDGVRKVTRDLFPSLSDSLTVYGNDPLLVRASTDAGAVDIWVMGVNAVSQTDVLTFVDRGQLMPMLRQPVMNVSRVSTSGTTYTEGVDYDVFYDVSGYSDSVRASDGIVFRQTGLAPTPGEVVNVTYTQNFMMEDVQSSLSTPNHDVIGRDTLIRAATQLNITIAANLTVRSGFSPSSVSSMVQSSILGFVNSLLLQAKIPGTEDRSSVQKSDVDGIVRRISGVDNFSFTQFCLVGATGNDDIPVGKNQYPRIAASAITISLV